MLNARKLEKYRQRLYTRIPLIGWWLRQRAAKVLAQAVAEGSAEAAYMLAEALTNHTDQKVRQIAYGTLSEARHQAVVDTVCQVWENTRDNALEELVLNRKWVATSTPEARVLTALKTKQRQVVANDGEEIVEPLLQACEDADREIAKEARAVLRELKNERLREAIYEAFVRADYPAARDAVVSAGYAPSDPLKRALFYFLTEQWEKYDSLDFDRRLMYSVYAAADNTLRQRIQAKLQKAGRVDLVTVIVGRDYRSRIGEMMPTELDLVLAMLEANGEWERLWTLVFEAPFGWSVRAMKALTQGKWRPQRDDEQEVFTQLAQLAMQEIAVTTEHISRILPPAVCRQQARVAGRANDVAFAPDRPIIAVGTGHRRVVLWDFQSAKRLSATEKFFHSIGRVTFLSDSTLLCAERTNTLETSCCIWFSKDGSKFEELGRHIGSVTAIEPVNGGQFLSAGRDGRCVLWDCQRRTSLREAEFKFWARSARVSPNGQLAALIHKGVVLIQLPGLSILQKLHWQDTSGSVTFAPDGGGLIVGKFNGEVLECCWDNGRMDTRERMLYRHSGPVCDVESVPPRGIVITGSSDGEITFIDWANRAVIGSVRLSQGRLTSLHVSPDGNFLAVGDSEASMTLWDLRVMDVAQLFAIPFARMTPMQMAVVEAILTNQLPKTVKVVLQFIYIVLQHRFRYEIEIDEVTTIRFGQFDIEIEG